MTSLTYPWAQHFDPKNFSQYTLEALASKTSSGELTREAAVLIDNFQNRIVNAWLHDSELTTRKIEKLNSGVCVKLLVMTLMPHLLLFNYEALLSEPLKRDHNSISSTTGHLMTKAPLPDANTESVLQHLTALSWAAFEKLITCNLDNLTGAVYQLLKNEGTEKHKLRLGTKGKFYSPELRIRFLALISFAHKRNYKLHFITVTLSDDESQQLINSFNQRSLEQKITRYLKQKIGERDFAGTVVIEKSNEGHNRFHVHIVIAMRELNITELAKLRQGLRNISAPQMKTAINITYNRRTSRLKGYKELDASNDKIFIHQELPGIDIGVMDYLSKDLNEPMKISRHNQVFNLNSNLFFSTDIKKKLQQLLVFLFKGAKKHIQFSNKKLALSEIKLCILSLVKNLRTISYKQNLELQKNDENYEAA